MASTLKQFKKRALARANVKNDDLAEEFSFLEQLLRARAEAGLFQVERNLRS